MERIKISMKMTILLTVNLREQIITVKRAAMRLRAKKLTTAITVVRLIDISGILRIRRYSNSTVRIQRTIN